MDSASIYNIYLITSHLISTEQTEQRNEAHGKVYDGVFMASFRQRRSGLLHIFSCCLGRWGARSSRSRCREHWIEEGVRSASSQAERRTDLRQDSEGVGVTQTSLPSLNGNDGLVGPDDAQVQSVLQTIPRNEKRFRKFAYRLDITSAHT